MDINVKSKFNIGDKVKSKRGGELGDIVSIRPVVYSWNTVVEYGVSFDNGDCMRVLEVQLEAVKPATTKFKEGDLVVLKKTERMSGYEFGEIVSHKDEMWGIMLTPAHYRYVYNESDMVAYIPSSPHYFQD